MTRLEGFIEHLKKEGAVIAMVDHSSACVSMQTLPSHVTEGDFIIEDDERHLLTVDPLRSELHHREVRIMNDSCFD